MGITVITGNGKGKTTSAIGLAMIAIAQGKRAAMVQFLKGNSYIGELFAAPRAGLEIYQFGWGCPRGSMIRSGESRCLSCGECFRENRDPKHGFAEKALNFACRLAESGNYQLLILDEISHALRHKLVDNARLVELMVKNRGNLDLVLTGRKMPVEMIDIADVAYELKEGKHPFQHGVRSRRGIEY
ncbi:MAG TPA: cob(I)yrinic acid a,c-diamide adenosyltransferase [Desulfobacteria bacterium]|nr:cob(I)yrinic acid a,c-diamide adenosyltransferase [Desulfobacteria bacterium]